VTTFGGPLVRYTTAIYVLHVFQKKSKRGAATPQRDMDFGGGKA